MKLIRFKAKKVFGHIGFDVKFNDDLTFLTGINGSGKTTVINFLINLLTPDIYELQKIRFHSAELQFLDDEGARRFIKASTGSDGTIRLEASGAEEPFTYRIFQADIYPNSPRLVEEEAEHFREVYATSTSHPVLQIISQLPTPMFLGLDRRARTDPRHFRGLRRTGMSRGEALTRSGLSGSLEEARRLAEESYRHASIRASRVGDELQQRMLLNLLTFSEQEFLSISSPTLEERQDIKNAIRDLDDFPFVFSVSPEQIKKRVLPFLNRLKEIADKIPDDYHYNSGDDKDQKIEHALQMLEWSANKNELKRIRALSDYVSNFNARRQVVLRPVEKFLGLVNSYVRDGGKEIVISENGDVKVKRKRVAGEIDLLGLSSGEAQLFIILANLSFNPSAQHANVFIIDEPELSLHIRWQELFVDSVMRANDKIQYIMATHSPSIILERVDNCIEVRA